jgi:quercetin dioxygenase-like cupin family protein
MPEILETFSTYRARIEKSLEGIEKPIILSTDVHIPTLKGGDDKSIEMVPIAWPLYKNTESMFYVVTVPPKKHTARHSHEEDIFRFVVKGSLVLNGSIQIKEGMWFVIKANTPYEIDTESGYKTIMDYSRLCASTRPGGTHWVDE